MITHPMNPVRSEKGVALIIVLLLLAVMAGLTTGLTLNGQTEIAMAHNETYYAAARAAAEAGMNRATEQIIGDTTTDLIANPTVPNIGNGPFALNDDYSYRFELLDDDDPALYGGVALTGPGAGTQLGAMNENGDPNLDQNSRMIVRSIATGPRGTTVTVARILMRDTIAGFPGMYLNPAILVNGNLGLDGNSLVVNGKEGNIHANGDISGGDTSVMGTGITGNVTATGEISDNIDPGGLKAGGMPVMPVPEIKAEDYLGMATHKLTSGGAMLVRTAPGIPGTWAACTGSGALKCPTEWTYSSTTNTWSADGAMPTSGVTKSTYYVEGNAEVHGTGKSTGFTEISIIAEGSLKITGNGKFKPGNDSKIQFVTNGDFELGGTADADDPLDMDGQIMVREQMHIYGNSKFQGRVMVEDRDGAANACSVSAVAGCRRGSSKLSDNNLSGNMTVTYNGQLGGIDVPEAPTTYTNVISGWMEQ
jgi:hypothetical protein